MKIFFTLMFFLFVFLSCKEESEEPISYKISEDICIACAEDPFFIICDDTMAITNIITPNSDGFNDVMNFFIFNTDSITCNLSNELRIYNRNGIELVNYDDYPGGHQGWPTFEPNSNNQNTENLTNGLYKYIINKGEESKTGYFIILLDFDEYLDLNFFDLPCVDSCFYFDEEDPLLDY